MDSVGYDCYIETDRRDELIEAMMKIHGIFRDSNVCWSISYHPDTDSYNIYVTKEKNYD